MFRSALVVAVTALSALAHAQNFSSSGNLTITASEVSSTLRQSWCRGQTIACPQICGGRASKNTCDSEQLTFECVCPDNKPRNISDYSQTLPFFVCEQWKTNCVRNHPDDRDGQADCESVTCGSQNATDSKSSSDSSSTASRTSSATPTSGGGAAETGASKTTASHSSSTPSATNSAAMNMAQNYGTGMLAAALLAVFGLAM